MKEAMTYAEGYHYYMTAYENGTYSLDKLKEIYYDYEKNRENWKKHGKNGVYGARDYKSYCNMQKALRKVIKEIKQSRIMITPVTSVSQLNLEMEAKKITIVHRILHSTCRKSINGDSFYHNLRAMLIGRIEQLPDANLIVDLDGSDPFSVAKIRDKKISSEMEVNYG